MCPTKHKKKHHHQSEQSASDDTAESWREETINGGSLRHVDLHTGSNGWASPPGDLFNVRGLSYFSRRQKCPAEPGWLLNPAGFDWLRSNSKLDHVLSRCDNRVMSALRHAHPKTFVVAVNLQVPGRDHYSAVFYFSSKPDRPIASIPILNEFVNGSDSLRNARFKIVNRIVKGPWIVKTAVGNYAACLLGKALTCSYHRGENYLEIDVDIGSSAIAKGIVKLALGCVTAVTVDMGFVVEAQSDEELPEKLFGAVRVCQMEMGSAKFVEGRVGTGKVLPVESGSSRSGGGGDDDNGED